MVHDSTCYFMQHLLYKNFYLENRIEKAALDLPEIDKKINPITSMLTVVVQWHMSSYKTSVCCTKILCLDY